MRRWVAILAILWFGMAGQLSLAAGAWGLEIEAGGGTTFARYETLHEAPVATLNLLTQLETNFPTEWSLGYISAQERNPVNNDRSVLWAGVGKRWRWRALFVGVGLVVIDHTGQRLSTHVNFKSQAGVRYGPLVGTLQHISNAGLAGANDGETFVTLGYRFRWPR